MLHNVSFLITVIYVVINSDTREEMVKDTLVKIGATAENGSSHGVLASRVTKLVMAATGKSPAFKPHPFPAKAAATAGDSSPGATPKRARPTVS